MTFGNFLQNLPLLHSWDGGKTWQSGGFQRHHLEQMRAVIVENFGSPRIVETGAGNSTIAFLHCDPEFVLSVCPEPRLFGRIVDYCSANTISAADLRAVVGFSQIELPKLVDEGVRADFALIDGAHGWPLVMVDFCYVNAMLSTGGLLMVDDVQLHSVRELANLLREQPEFELVADLGKSLIFRKITDAPYLPEWNQQPYIVRMSKP